jgi:hypothetical protein
VSITKSVPDFSSLPSYFSRASNRFQSYLKLKKTLMCGALWSVASSPCAAPWLAAVGGAIQTRAARVFRRRIPCPKRIAVVRRRPRLASPRLARRPDSLCLKPPPPFRFRPRVSECTTPPSPPGRASPPPPSPSPPSRAAECHVIGCLTAAPLPLRSGELTAPPTLL